MTVATKPRALFVVESSRFNISSAREFGEIVYLLKGEPVSPLNVDEVVSRIKEALDDIAFDPKNDYVVLTGQTLLVAVYLAIACDVSGQVRTLMFDARHDKYVERVVKL